MTQSTRRFSFLVSALAVAAAGVGLAGAHDESADVTIKIEAPLTASACTAASPTISVLGLNIDTTKASFDVESEDSGSPDVSSAGSKSSPSATCQDLTPGAPVEVSLASDVDPLEATRVEQDGGNETSLQAPIQQLNTDGTIQLLGLPVDISGAQIAGDDDDSDDGNTQPLDASQLVAGQFVEVRLDPSQLPDKLVATEIDVKNFANQVEVEVEDEQGEDVNDDSDSVDVDASVSVVVKTIGANGKPKAVRRTVRITKATNGRFVLSGLPKGVATIKIARNVNGTITAARKPVKVLPNRTRTVVLRLHKTRSR